jgi:hypothetical protein
MYSISIALSCILRAERDVLRDTDVNYVIY